MAAGTSSGSSIRIIGLGGLGEIGLNFMVLESAGHAIVIDCGVMFPEDPLLASGAYVPDFAYVESARLRFHAVLLTHAHEDHIGALPHLLRRIDAPVYGSEVALAYAARRLREAEFTDRADLRVVAPRGRLELGPFGVEFIRVTHSTPQSFALAISTLAGLIVHTGDFKIDDAPVDGAPFERERFAQLGQAGVALLLSDSTNVERAGRAGSESSLKPVLRDLVGRTRGRFFLTAFSSHLHRIVQVADVSREFGRRIVPLGRRMAESVRIGIETGQLHHPPGTFVDPSEAEFLAPQRLTYLTGGSQGEPSSALAKLAADTHPRVHVEPGDSVVLSSRFIPGNERTINTLVNRLCKRGAAVFYDAVAPVHVSGHAARDELAEMLALTRPRYFVPIHGEYRHLSRHLSLAGEAGLPERSRFLLEDGDALVLGPAGAHRAQSVKAGRVLVEGEALSDPAVMAERRALAHDGTVTALVVVSAKNGRMMRPPELHSLGLVSGDGSSPHVRNAGAELEQALRDFPGPLRARDAAVKEEISRVLRRYFSDALGKRPVIVPIVTEV